MLGIVEYALFIALFSTFSLYINLIVSPPKFSVSFLRRARGRLRTCCDKNESMGTVPIDSFYTLR